MKSSGEAGARRPTLQPDGDFGVGGCFRVTPLEPPLTGESDNIITGGLQLLAQAWHIESPPINASYLVHKEPDTSNLSHCLAFSPLHSPELTMKGLPLVTKVFCLKTRGHREGTRTL